MALFQSQTYSTMMHQPQNGHSREGTLLANAVPSAELCTISELMAFPTSLAALKHGIKWNASCWTANQRLNEFEQEQIGLYAFRGQQRTPHIEWCQFATDVNDTVSILIVFPELKTSFRAPDIMQRWTDTVVLPAFRAVGVVDSTLTSNFNIIQMTAEAEREQTLNTFAPDTTTTEILRKHQGFTPVDAHHIWAAIQNNANQTSFFDGFKNLFLVAIHKRPGQPQKSLPMNDAWQRISSTWDTAIDMNFVPMDTIHAHAIATIDAHAAGFSIAPTTNGHMAQPVQSMSADSMWESARKRRLDDDDDVDKRVKQSDANEVFMEL